MKIRMAMVGVVSLLWMACGGSNPGVASPTLAVTPKPAPAVTAGGSGVTFTATLANAADTINWTLTPATGAGTINPATGANTIYTPPASVSASTTVTLTATAGTLTDSVTITVDPPAAITVAGKIVTLSGMPVANSAVVIGSQSTISDADGNFTISNVTTPYDLVSVVSSPAKYGVVYQGLTRTDPTIVQYSLTIPLPYSGTATGNIATPLAAKNYVAWGSPETVKNVDLAANPYSLSLSWRGSPSTTGTLHALKWSIDGSGLPAVYRGYGLQTDVTVADSGTTTVPDIAMTSVTPAHISGSVVLPASYTLESKMMSIAFPSRASIPILVDSTSTESFSYLTPDSIGGTITLLANAKATGVGASSVGKKGLAADATDVTLVPQEISAPGLPANGATGITTDTDFSWTRFTGGLHLVSFLPTVSTDPAFFVFTTETTTKIPDLSAQGLGLPSGGATYGWGIIAVAPWASLDAFAGGREVYPTATSDTIYESISVGRSFTTL